MKQVAVEWKKNSEKYYHSKTPGFLTQEATILSPPQRLLLFWPVASLYNQLSFLKKKTILYQLFEKFILILIILIPPPNLLRSTSTSLSTQFWIISQPQLCCTNTLWCGACPYIIKFLMRTLINSWDSYNVLTAYTTEVYFSTWNRKVNLEIICLTIILALGRQRQETLEFKPCLDWLTDSL